MVPNVFAKLNLKRYLSEYKFSEPCALFFGSVSRLWVIGYEYIGVIGYGFEYWKKLDNLFLDVLWKKTELLIFSLVCTVLMIKKVAKDQIAIIFYFKINWEDFAPELLLEYIHGASRALCQPEEVVEMIKSSVSVKSFSRSNWPVENTTRSWRRLDCPCQNSIQCGRTQ